MVLRRSLYSMQHYSHAKHSQHRTSHSTSHTIAQHSTSHAYPLQHSTAQHSTAQHSTAQCCIATACLGSGNIELVAYLAAAWRAASAANAACLCSAVCAALHQQITGESMGNATSVHASLPVTAQFTHTKYAAWIIALLTHVSA